MPMYQKKQLEIVGYHDEPVPNTFLQQEGEAQHIAVVFPGMGYTCDMPLLYYATEPLLSRGADVLLVEYGYNRRGEFRSASDEEQTRWFIADVTAALRAALAQRPYTRVTLIGKSLGTLALGHLLATEQALENARAVWLTPLLRDERLRGQIRQWGGRSLFAIGSADPHYDTTLVDEVRGATGGEAVVVEGADHSIEFEGDLSRSLEALGTVMRAVEEFVRET
jgi:hypothetical protein